MVKNFDKYVGKQAGSQERGAWPKEITDGNAQKCSCTLLLVLPPIALERFRPQNSIIYMISEVFAVFPAASYYSTDDKRRLTALPIDSLLIPAQL